jgi:hypothetical protein
VVVHLVVTSVTATTVALVVMTVSVPSAMLVAATA